MAAARDEKLKVKYRGKDYQITREDHEQLVEQVFKRLERYISALISTNKLNQKTYREYLDSAEVRNGFFDAITQGVIVRVGRVKYPNAALASASMKACENLARAQASRNIAQLNVALPLAEKAVNAFSADVMRFLSEFIGSADTTATVLTVTSAGCFAVVGALAAPVLVAGGMSAAGGAMAAGGGVAALSSAASELGNVASGQKFEPWESLRNVAIDTALGTVTAGAGAKIPLGFVEKIAKSVAPALAARIPGVSVQVLTPYIQKFLTGSGEEAIKAAVGEAIAVVGKMAKEGKVPDANDFMDAAKKVLIAGLTGGLMKHIATFQKKWAMSARGTLEGQLFPDILKSVMKGNNQLPPVVKAKVWADVWGKVSETAIQTGLGAAMDAGKGLFEPSKMEAEAEKVVLKDNRIRKLVEEETKKALKKQKIEVR